jgi:gluconokinase
MGVSGAGKSTVAALSAAQLGWRFVDADEFHSVESLAKMSRGIPLCSSDRKPWLEAIRLWLEERSVAGIPAVIACSALKREYRHHLRQVTGQVGFVHLVVDMASAIDRVTSRRGHFMSPSLIGDQFATLEPLEPDELGISIDIAHRSPEVIAQLIADWSSAGLTA